MIKEKHINKPHHKQEKKWTCLPSCIRICLELLGKKLDEEEIAKLCETNLFGTKPQNAEKSVKGLGFNCSRITVNLNNIFNFVSNDIPVVIWIYPAYVENTERLHAVIVNGYSTKGIVYFDPYHKKEIEEDYVTFSDRLETNNNGMIIWK
jgi:ABC-type bacteriocin/lantibiotic exporter with double-glycine peptidase domain